MNQQVSSAVLINAWNHLTPVSEHPIVPDGRWITDSKELETAKRAVFETGGHDLSQDEEEVRNALMIKIHHAEEIMFFGNPVAIVAAVLMSLLMIWVGSREGKMDVAFVYLLYYGGGAVGYYFACRIPKYKVAKKLLQGETPVSVQFHEAMTKDVVGLGDWLGAIFWGLIFYPLFLPLLALWAAIKNQPWRA